MLNKIILINLMFIFTSLSATKYISYEEYTDNIDRAVKDFVINRDRDLEKQRSALMDLGKIYFLLNDQYFFVGDGKVDHKVAVDLLKKDFTVESLEEGIRRLNYLFDIGYRSSLYKKLDKKDKSITFRSLVIRDFYEITSLLILLRSANLIEDHTYFTYLDSIPLYRFANIYINEGSKQLLMELASSFYFESEDMVRRVCIAGSQTNLYNAFGAVNKTIFHSYADFKFDPNNDGKYDNVNLQIIDYVAYWEQAFIKYLENNNQEEAMEYYEPSEISDRVLWNGKTYIEYFVDYGHTESIKLLLELGFDPNKKSSSGNTGFSRLIEKDKDSDLIPLLIRYGADPMFGDSGGVTPLGYVVLTGGSFYLKDMLEKVKNLDLEIKDSWYYIHGAARYLRYQDFILIASKVKNLDIKTKDGLTPQFMAQHNETFYKEKIVEFLATK